jgi:hypothetical protein
MYVFNAVSRFHQATGEETMVRQRWRGVRRRVVVVGGRELMDEHWLEVK